MRTLQLREKSYNGRFACSHTLIATNKKGKEQKITADRFLIATGL